MNDAALTQDEIDALIGDITEQGLIPEVQTKTTAKKPTSFQRVSSVKPGSTSSTSDLSLENLGLGMFAQTQSQPQQKAEVKNILAPQVLHGKSVIVACCECEMHVASNVYSNGVAPAEVRFPDHDHIRTGSKCDGSGKRGVPITVMQGALQGVIDALNSIAKYGKVKRRGNQFSIG